jgi:hypothetical protein
MLPPDESARKRTFEDLAAAVDRELDDDRRWFAANPRRTYRARRTFPTEQLRELTVAGDSCPPGYRCFTVVKQVAPGARMRQLFTAPRGFMLPVTQPGIARLWERLADDAGDGMTAKIEASIRGAA